MVPSIQPEQMENFVQAVKNRLSVIGLGTNALTENPVIYRSVVDSVAQWMGIPREIARDLQGLNGMVEMQRQFARGL
jgi:hypothetical protein